METAVTFPRSFITRYITTQNVRTVMISKLLLKIVTLGLADKRKVSGSVLFPGIIFRSTVAPCCIRKSAII